MTIIVEDGSIVASANSYADSDDLETFADDRGITLTTDPDILLLKAMDGLYGRAWKGSRVSSLQELEWPRSGVYRDGELIASDSIPRELVYAQLHLAIAYDTVDLTPVQEVNGKGAVIEERVEGAVTVKYAENKTMRSIASVAPAEFQLRHLLRGSPLTLVRS